MHGTGCLGLVHWDDPEVQGGRREEGSERGTRVYLWWIHVAIWQNQYNIVKLKKKKKLTFLGLYGTTPLPFECCMVMTNFPAASWFSISAVYLETSGKL